MSKSLNLDQLGLINNLVADYLKGLKSTDSFYNETFDLDGIRNTIKQKTGYSEKNRRVLCRVIEEQYGDFDFDYKILTDRLAKSKCYTFTTGHQLSLFSGPMYFVYKILHVIKLAEYCKQEIADCDFIPIFWLASEDHDFDEISVVNLYRNQIKWDQKEQGSVGGMSLVGVDNLIDEFTNILDGNEHAKECVAIIKCAYAEGNLSNATRKLAHLLLKEYDFLVVDGDSRKLKAIFASTANRDIANNISYDSITSTNTELDKNGYKSQVYVRELNFFYKDKGWRERLIYEKGKYKVNNSDISIDESILTDAIDSDPERFSPNALLRPLYQETVLPNIGYVGGGAEVSYWLQLKAMFDEHQVPFPLIILRNSLCITSRKSASRLKELNLEFSDLFRKAEDLEIKVVEKADLTSISVVEELDELRQLLERLRLRLSEFDSTLTMAVDGVEKSNIKGFDQINNKIKKIGKRKLEIEINRALKLKEEVFPDGVFQERFKNVFEFYSTEGNEIIKLIYDAIDPMESSKLKTILID